MTNQHLFMNQYQRLSVWADEWAECQTASRQMERLQAEFAVGRGDEEAVRPGVGGPGLTVGVGFDLEAVLLEQLTAPMAPTLGAEGQDLTVSAVAGRSAVRVGQILHLPPSLHSGVRRSVYALVLGIDEENQRVEVVPFGPVTVPALVTEMRTDLPDRMLAVLCLWNVAWLGMKDLERCWMLSDVDEGLMKRVDALREALKKGDSLPEDLKALVGPPLEHPADPRMDYIATEERLWEQVESGEAA
jgi:hypothetical protein